MLRQWGLDGQRKPWALRQRIKTHQVDFSMLVRTDAFGVVNFITLACETGEARYLQQARRTVLGSLPAEPSLAACWETGPCCPPQPLHSSRDLHITTLARLRR